MLWWRLQQLRSLEWKVRSKAAEKLGESGDPKAVPALVKALKDKDPNVRAAAAGGLGNIGDTSALEPLLDALQDYDWSVRGAAVEALGRLRDERVIDMLLPLLKTKDGELRSTVARALETVGGPKLNPAQHAACAVARMKWDEVAKMGEAAIEPLLEAIGETKTQVRVAAVGALERIGHERAIAPLIALLKDGDIKVQEAACWALADMGDARAVMPLAQLSRNSVVYNIAVAALERLVKRVAQSIAVSDLQAIAQLDEQPATDAPLTARANSSAQSHATDLSNITNLARQELIRRGLLTRP